jgi:hypothetical protein
MPGQRVRLDLDLSPLPEDALRFAEAIATELRYQCPALFDAVGWTIEHERARRSDGVSGLVLFVMPAGTVADAYEAARVALGHSFLCLSYAAGETDPEAVASFHALAGLFRNLHFAIIAADAPALLAYHAQVSPPPNAA